MTAPDHALRHFPRLFAPHGDPYGQCLFVGTEWVGDELLPALAVPEDWSAEAAAVMADAAGQGLPGTAVRIEENTVPSWLWRRQLRAGTDPVIAAPERDLRDILDRVAGSAVAHAWRAGWLRDEQPARILFDEWRAALTTRVIAIEPKRLRGLGLNWAYGLPDTTYAISSTIPAPVGLTNPMVDALTGRAGIDHGPQVWTRLFHTDPDRDAQIDLRFDDIARDWHSLDARPAGAVIDVMRLRDDKGTVCIAAVRQAVRLLAVLLDLHGLSATPIGIANLSPLLLALGLAYDSEAGRALAASLLSLVTAEALATSAEMAALRGASADFTDHRECCLRALRNHRRATLGEVGDYEKLSVAPAPLAVKHCPDLALAAASQRRWDEVLTLVQAHGLRAVQVTDLTTSADLALLTGANTQGLTPMPTLAAWRPRDDDATRVDLHPAAHEALTRLGYAPAAIAAMARHVAGMRSLRHTPAINHASLSARGLTQAMLDRIESYIPQTDRIALAITPWVVGVEACAALLGCDAATVTSPGFDLLTRLGFTADDRAAAQRACYGAGHLRDDRTLALRHRPLLGCGNDIGVDARLRMAAAAQPMITGSTGIVIRLAAQGSVDSGARTTLAAWRRGLHGLRVLFDPTLSSPDAEAITKARRIGRQEAQSASMPKAVTRTATKRRGKPVPAQPGVARKNLQK